MPKRSDLKSILIIGAGPIVIGQACEFDYSGAQACKALREEGYRVILVNSNPATIMTDPQMADATYIEPISWKVVKKIIQIERPDAILPTMGGQTALNCALDLHRHGVLTEYEVELIGAKPEAIEKAENRAKFKAAISSIGLESARSDIAHDLQQALAIQQKLGFPVIIRPSFTLGGTGGGIAYNPEEFQEICKRGFDLSPNHELLIEECLLGWKEFEMEVVRDKADNCIIVCAIENLDPMGIHTGDSITVAPTQTLTDKEYQIMRNASFAVLREIGVETGGSNVQFAVDPKTGRMLVIEMNPRVSRSSALASKATGFPIAKIATKLAIGYTLDELGNDMTGGATPASFEPTIDYVVCKIPRFAFEKFPVADARLSSQMKSVGEVMAIGRNFQESLQKALRGLETGISGLNERSNDLEVIAFELSAARPERILYVADAFRQGMSIDEVFQLSAIDPWFLAQIQDLVGKEQALRKRNLASLNAFELKQLKRAGFSDERLAKLLGCKLAQIRQARHQAQIHPVYKHVDSCASEFESPTAYLYSSYDDEDEAQPNDREKILILGGGPNRIGQGIEFDYCCVHAALALREDGYEVIMLNCNPETVSTDYDVSDRLYFEPVTLEDVYEVVLREKPKGVIVQYGGQTPLKLALHLEELGVPIIGTSPDSIDAAEDRERFATLVQQLALQQPPNRIAYNEAVALTLAHEIGYPLVVRPSYVLGGRAMEIVHGDQDLQRYMNEAVKVSQDSPVLLDSFLNDAIEVDVDCVSDGQTTIVAGIMEHIEHAGVHSGDSACCLPPHSLSESLQTELRKQTVALAQALNVCGLMNIQFAITNAHNADVAIYLLEVNPRASRTIPFVSKATSIAYAKVGARCMIGKTLLEQNIKENIPHYFSVKEAVFPFARFTGVDPILGPEMRSTGEVMGIGESFGEAMYKAQLAASEALPTRGTVCFSVKNSDKSAAIAIAKILQQLNFNIVATRGTAQAFIDAGVTVQMVQKVKEGRPHIVDLIKAGEIQLLFTTVEETRSAIEDSRSIRINALAERIPYWTTMAGAHAAVIAIQSQQEVCVKSLQNLWRSSASNSLSSVKTH